MQELQPDKKILLELVTTIMPYGKHKGRLICDIPVHYIVWMKQNDAMPTGTLGDKLHTVFEIKSNDLGHILYELKKWKNEQS